MPTALTYERAYCDPVVSPIWPKELSRLLVACCALSPAKRPPAEAAAVALSEFGGGEKGGAGARRRRATAPTMATGQRGADAAVAAAPAMIKLGSNAIGVCSAAAFSPSSSGGLQDGAVRRSNSFPSKGAPPA